MHHCLNHCCLTVWGWPISLMIGDDSTARQYGTSLRYPTTINGQLIPRELYVHFIYSQVIPDTWRTWIKYLHEWVCWNASKFGQLLNLRALLKLNLFNIAYWSIQFIYGQVFLWMCATQNQTHTWTIMQCIHVIAKMNESRVSVSYYRHFLKLFYGQPRYLSCM